MNRETWLNEITQKYLKDHYGNNDKFEICELILMDISSERLNYEDIVYIYKVNLLNGEIIIDYDNNKNLSFYSIYLKKIENNNK